MGQECGLVPLIDEVDCLGVCTRVQLSPAMPEVGAESKEATRQQSLPLPPTQEERDGWRADREQLSPHRCRSAGGRLNPRSAATVRAVLIERVIPLRLLLLRTVRNVWLRVFTTLAWRSAQRNGRRVSGRRSPRVAAPLPAIPDARPERCTTDSDVTGCENGCDRHQDKGPPGQRSHVLVTRLCEDDHTISQR